MTNNTTLQKPLILGSLLVGVFSILTIICCLIYYSNRGFELSDETFYLSFSNYFNAETYTTSDFGLLNNMVCFGNPTLINLRIAKLVYQIIAVLFFIWSLFKYLDFKNISINLQQKTFIAIVIIVTSFAHYDYLPMTLSYNSWSLILTLFFLGIVLLEFTITSVLTGILSSSFAGFLCFALFISKLPNGAIAMVLYGMFNLFYIKKNTVIKIAGFTIGVFLSYFLILKNSNNFFALIENYRITIFEVKHAESDTYFKQIFKVFSLMGQHKFKSIIILMVLLSAGFMGIKLISKIKNITTKSKHTYAHLILIIGFLFCLPFYKGNGHKTYNDFIAGTFLIINPILFVYFFNPVKAKLFQFFKSDLNTLSIVLILMPVLLMLGTNNAFYYSVSPTMTFAFAGILIYLVKSKTNYTQYLAVFSLVSSLFVLSIYYHGAVKKPYRQGNLNNKTYPLSFNPLLNGVYESRAAFIDYTSVNCIMNNLNQEHKPILSFFNFYGFTVINDVKMVTDLPLSAQERNLELANYLLNKGKVKDLNPLILLPDTIIGIKKFESVFAKHNIYLNQNYKLLYKYKFLSSDEKVSFYKKTL